MMIAILSLKVLYLLGSRCGTELSSPLFVVESLSDQSFDVV